MQVVQPIYLAIIGVPPVLIGLTASVALVAGAFKVSLLRYSFRQNGTNKNNLHCICYIHCLQSDLLSSSRLPYVHLSSYIGGSGGESLGHIEGALLAEKAGDSKRTLAFSTQYFVSSIFSAVGSLASGLPEVLVATFQIQSLDAIRFIFAVQAIIVLVAALLTLFIKDSRITVGKEENYLSKESRAKVIKFSSTNLIDGFGVGMIISLFSLWFYLRFGIGIQTVGYIFTVSKVFETVAYLSASPISTRLGLVRTVSFSRLAGAVSVGLMAFMPTYTLAAVMYVVRNVTQHVSIPARQSYIMAIFTAENVPLVQQSAIYPHFWTHCCSYPLRIYHGKHQHNHFSTTVVSTGRGSQLRLLYALQERQTTRRKIVLLLQ